MSGNKIKLKYFKYFIRFNKEEKVGEILNILKNWRKNILNILNMNENKEETFIHIPKYFIRFNFIN